MRNFLAASLILFSTTVFATADIKEQVTNVEVTDKGFVPTSIEVKANVPVTLKVTRKTDTTCAKSIQVPDLKVKKDLPLNKTVTVKLGKLKTGELRFGCAMDMMEGGKIIVH